jgi:predicted anti-sigma-YlaC factor YlaD
MNCATCREVISADLDGEAGRDEQEELGRHLASCPDCRRYEADARAAHRSWRVQAAPEVPDLTERILAGFDNGHPGPSAPRGRRAGVLRVALAALALTQFVLAGPELVEHADFNDELHALHHLNAWAIAFAVGLAVVAWQPWRVRGLLPLATALGGLMAFTVGLDVINRHAIAMPAAEHFIEGVGLVLLWVLARTDGLPGPAGTGHTRRWSPRVRRHGAPAPGRARRHPPTVALSQDVGEVA